MIKYNNSNINDWNFGEDNIIKVYRNNAVCYYKIDTSSPSGQTPCFAVVDDISQYSDTEFEDVFNKADGLWYKLNNLNQYEEYGVYGSGRNVTTYEGKLTIDDGYEYMYSGGSWVNVGAISGSTITIKSPEYIERTSSYKGRINLDYVWKTNTKMQFKFYSTNNGGGSMIGELSQPDNNDCRVFFASTTAYFDYGSGRIQWSSNGRTNRLYEYEYGNYYIKNMATSASQTGTTFSSSRTNPLYLGAGNSDYFRTYYVKFYEGNTLVKDFIPWTDTNGNFGLYEKVSNAIYSADSGSFTASTVWNDVEVGGGYIYPIEYVVMQDPPNNITFTSMTEAEDYECPWVGMRATIDGSGYTFSGDSQSGYEWVYIPSRLPQGYTEVEYIQNTGTSYINTNLQLCSATTNTFQVEAKLVANRIGSDTYQNIFACMSEAGEPYQGFTYRFQGTTITPTFIPSNDGSFTQVTNEDSTISVTASSINGLTYSHTYPLTICCGLNSSRSPFRYTNTKVYTFKVTLNNNVVADYVPAMRDSDSKYGLYDLITDTFLVSPNGSNFVGGSPV